MCNWLQMSCALRTLTLDGNVMEAVIFFCSDLHVMTYKIIQVVVTDLDLD